MYRLNNKFNRMDNHSNNFLVYENWRAENKAVVHKSTCKHANEGHDRNTN